MQQIKKSSGQRWLIDDERDRLIDRIQQRNGLHKGAVARQRGEWRAGL
jgi:hypothetical protein